jgi:hypothetical protein
VTEATVESMIKKLDNNTSTLVKASVDPIFDAVFGNLTKAEVQSELLQIFVDLAQSNNAYPVVIIDEANVVLGRGKNDSEIILQDLVARTKQKRELPLILASSEHAYPYQLEREGLNLLDVTRVIFAGEIPPSDMWKRLVILTGNIIECLDSRIVRGHCWKPWPYLALPRLRRPRMQRLR